MQKPLDKLKNKKIACLGLGMENYALIKFLLNKKIKCAISICDRRGPEALGAKFTELDKRKNIAWKLGEENNQNLDGFDILFRSPGWPLFDPAINEARKAGVMISSPIKLFFDLCPSHKIIGVTGTKGKGTVSSLIYHIFKTANRRAWLGGNIGVAPFSFLPKIKKNDYVVLELSSFQLEDMRKSPHIAVITNFAKEHLLSSDPNNPNCHTSLQSYWNAKFQILKHQRKSDFAVIGGGLKGRVKQKDIKARLIYFNKSQLDSKLPGEHNKKNIAAAVQAAKIAKIKSNAIKKAAADFKGLEHRLEFIESRDNTAYYDDSFATTPDSAATAIKSFHTPIILLAGGADKKSDFKKLARLIKQKVKFAVLFRGPGSKRLKKQLLANNYPAGRIRIADSMKEAVKIAAAKTDPGGTVLLSPACASFGIFKNYKDRGNQFREEVKKLK